MSEHPTLLRNGVSPICRSAGLDVPADTAERAADYIDKIELENQQMKSELKALKVDHSSDELRRFQQHYEEDKARGASAYINALRHHLWKALNREAKLTEALHAFREQCRRLAAALEHECETGRCFRQSAESKRSRAQVLNSHAEWADSLVETHKG